MTQTESKSNRLGWWAIVLPLILQTGLIAVVPLRAAIATLMGQTIVLQTVPVDPYDPLRGYYTTLQYDISQRSTLNQLDGWETVSDSFSRRRNRSILESGKPFFLILEAPASASTGAFQSEEDGMITGRLNAPAPWQSIAISRQRPGNLPDNQIAVQGIHRSDRIIYGLERYYLPEDERIDLDNQIRAAQTPENSPRLLVEIRIGPFNSAVPVALWIQGDRIEF